MFLTNAEIVELMELDLTDLVEMLSQQTMDYLELVKADKYSSQAAFIKKSIQNIQQAIETKRDFRQL